MDNLAVIQQAQLELQAYQKKWLEELLKKLGIDPTGAGGLNLSFDSGVTAPEFQGDEDFQLGFYASRNDGTVLAEATHHDLVSGTVHFLVGIGQKPAIDTSMPDTVVGIEWSPEKLSAKVFKQLFVKTTTDTSSRV